MLDALIRDLRSTSRLLTARPGWTMAAILCLAIATGANTAAFSIVNGLLLRPLPFDHPDELVMVALREPAKTATRPFALREYREVAVQAGGIGQLLARTFFPLSLADGHDAQMTQTELVSGNYFDVLRVQPFAGRFFDARADRAGTELQGVVSEALWRRRFGADPAIVGRVMRVNGRPMVVAGIAPPGFVGAMQLVAADLWLPAAAYPELARSTGADAVPMFGVMGRLAPRIGIDEAQARLTALAAGLASTRGETTAPAVIVTAAAGFGVPPAAAGSVLTLSVFVYLLMAMLTAVACANVAALVLARGAGRTREMAVRLSLGASRIDIARQLVTESVALALAGCAAGTVVALWLTRALVARLATPFQYVSYAIDVRPDAHVLASSAIATTLAAVLCGIAPIRYAARIDVLDLLKRHGLGTRGRESMRAFHATVVVQFAVSTTLLTGAGMLVRTYAAAQSAPSGFDTAGVIAMTIDARQIGLDQAAGIRLYEDVMTRLSALPGAHDVGLTRDPPYGPGRTAAVIGGSGAAAPPGEIIAAAMAVSAGYFQTLGVPILRGRAFDNDQPAQTPVAIVNEAMARRLWPGASPLGQLFRVSGGNDEPIEVIGIVPDIRQRSAAQPAAPAFYRPFSQDYGAQMTVLTRAHGDPAVLFDEIRRTIRHVDADLSIVDLRTVDQIRDSVNTQNRIPATVLSLVALLGLLLSAVGLSGVVAYGVRERAREIGIRLALGARPSDVRRLVLRQGFAIIGTGAAAGSAGTILLARAVRRVLFGVEALDPITLALVCIVLCAAGCAALYLPARWASRLQPAQTLRAE